MPYSWFLAGWWLILVSAALLAFLRCGRVERLVVTGLIINSLASVAVLSDHDWNRLQWPLIIADTALLLLFLAVAFSERRAWTIALAAITMGLVSLHLVTILAWPDVWVPAYAVLTILFSWLLLLTLTCMMAISAFGLQKGERAG